MKFTNLDIRELLKKNKIYQWQVAQELGMQDSNFSKLMRQELSKDKKDEIIKIINDILSRG